MLWQKEAEETLPYLFDQSVLFLDSFCLELLTAGGIFVEIEGLLDRFWCEDARKLENVNQAVFFDYAIILGYKM